MCHWTSIMGKKRNGTDVKKQNTLPKLLVSNVWRPDNSHRHKVVWFFVCVVLLLLNDHRTWRPHWAEKLGHFHFRVGCHMQQFTRTLSIWRVGVWRRGGENYDTTTTTPKKTDRAFYGDPRSVCVNLSSGGGVVL